MAVSAGSSGSDDGEDASSDADVEDALPVSG
jgi:hypothetical protein